MLSVYGLGMTHLTPVATVTMCPSDPAYTAMRATGPAGQPHPGPVLVTVEPVAVAGAVSVTALLTHVPGIKIHDVHVAKIITCFLFQTTIFQFINGKRIKIYSGQSYIHLKLNYLTL